MVLEIDADIPAHNDDLDDDQLTVLVVNYRWRRILVPLLEPLARSGFWTGTDDEIQDATQKAIALIEDVYSVESLKVKKTGARVRRGSNLSTSPGTIVVPMDEPGALPSTYDTDGFWNASNPDRLTVPLDMGGTYRVICQVRFQAGALANCNCFINTLPYAEVAVEMSFTSGVVGFNLLADIDLAAGDWVRVDVNSSIARVLQWGGAAGPWLSLHKLDGSIVPTM